MSRIDNNNQIKSNMEHILKKSRVCLAGRFNAKQGLRHEELSSSNWKRIKMSTTEYESMKSFYYESLLRSMIEIDDDVEQSVYRYEMILPEQCGNLMVLKKEDGTRISYPCKMKNIQLWFFPFNIVLFSIDIEESSESFSDLILMHRKWKAWFSNYDEFHTTELDDLLKPLSELSHNNNPSKMTYGTKMRQYQVILTELKKDEFETDTIKDELLYEIGSFSDVGIVADSDLTKDFKPAADYYNQLIRDNTLSVYSSWKALALNDSFTVLSIDDYYLKNEYEENFTLLYMRCLFEEFYCFDRNNLYHEVKDTDIDSKAIESEIAYMEKHYFYEDMSYNFLPPLMYRAMAKGLELQKDREQLTQHVKQALRDARRERNSSAVNFVQIFAVFSVVWTIREILTAIWPCIKGSESAIISGIFALIFTIVLLKRPQLLNKLFQNN